MFSDLSAGRHRLFASSKRITEEKKIGVMIGQRRGEGLVRNKHDLVRFRERSFVVMPMIINTWRRFGGDDGHAERK